MSNSQSKREEKNTEVGISFASYLKPVNGTAIDKRREFSEPLAESIADGTHGQHNMQLVADARNEEIEQRHRGAVSLLGPLTCSAAHHPCREQE